MFRLSTLSLVVIAIFAGCSESTEKKETKKVMEVSAQIHYSSPININLSGIDGASINKECNGEVAFRALNEQFLQNAYDVRFVDFKTLKTNPTSNECQMRLLAMDRTQGIFSQEMVSYKISNANDRFSIALQENNGTLISPPPSIALDNSCGGINAKTIAEYMIASDYFEQIGALPSIGIDNIATENKTNSTVTCSATMTVYNPDPYAANSDSVLEVQNIRYQIVKTDDNQHILFKKL